MLNNNFQFKREIIHSVLFNNLNFNIKKVNIDLKSLIEFFKILNKKKGKDVFFSNLQIFDIFEQSGAIKSDYSVYDPTQKITLYVNNHFLLDPLSFVEKYSKEILLKEDLKEIKIIRCSECHTILPMVFVLDKSFNSFIIKPFAQKLKEEYLFVITRLFKHKYFKNRGKIETVSDLYESLKELYEQLVNSLITIG